MIGVVAEFDPFHNGHRYLLDRAREATGEETVVTVMSGSFVQRGAPAVMDVSARTACALAGGADVVFELPLTFALAPAERFAFGAVSLLASTGCVTHLAFGSECGDAARITRVAEALSHPAVPALIRERMRGGTSFAAAREQVVRETVGSDASLLRTPNDILAVEYVKALIRLNSPIVPVAVRRTGAPHGGAPEGDVASASFIRTLLRDGADASAYLPEGVREIVRKEQENGGLRFADDRVLLAALRRLAADELAALPEVREGLEKRIYVSCREAQTMDEFASAVSCRRYTKATARRVACYALLGLRKDDLLPSPACLHLLGASERGTANLRQIKQNASLPLIAKPADAGDLLRWEARASDLAGLFAAVPAKGAKTYKSSPVFTKN